MENININIVVENADEFRKTQGKLVESVVVIGMNGVVYKEIEEKIVRIEKTTDISELAEKIAGEEISVKTIGFGWKTLRKFQEQVAKGEMSPEALEYFTMQHKERVQQTIELLEKAIGRRVQIDESLKGCFE